MPSVFSLCNINFLTDTSIWLFAEEKYTSMSSQYQKPCHIELACNGVATASVPVTVEIAQTRKIGRPYSNKHSPVGLQTIGNGDIKAEM